jgi:hypothetical protein
VELEQQIRVTMAVHLLLSFLALHQLVEAVALVQQVDLHPLKILLALVVMA